MFNVGHSYYYTHDALRAPMYIALATHWIIFRAASRIRNPPLIHISFYPCLEPLRSKKSTFCRHQMSNFSELEIFLDGAEKKDLKSFPQVLRNYMLVLVLIPLFGLSLVLLPVDTGIFICVRHFYGILLSQHPEQENVLGLTFRS